MRVEHVHVLNNRNVLAKHTENVQVARSDEIENVQAEETKNMQEWASVEARHV